jgi:alpha/beta superfamily hydrolase
MAEQHTEFEANGVTLRGLLESRPGERGVVVTHPHPLYGGNMHNNVVEAVRRAYRAEGCGTLRFDFRSVRNGSADEQAEGECQDVKAAIDHFRASGATCVDLAGYSFGAWVNALALPDFAQVERSIMVAPPVRFLDFSSVESDDRVALVVTGSEDDFAPPDDVKTMLSSIAPQARLEIIAGADHFFGRHTDVLIDTIRDFLLG